MTETQKKVKDTKMKKVSVLSKTLFNEKVVVVYKKIKPALGAERELFNIYMFNIEGEATMLERDAIIFWKQRKSMEKQEDDLTLLSIPFKKPYVYEDVKDLYNVETEGLSNTEQPKK